jgi:hypothetical protein
MQDDDVKLFESKNDGSLRKGLSPDQDNGRGG